MAEPSPSSDTEQRPALREGDTGSYVELAARPNPDGLVVRHVFSLESTRQTLQADLGRDLTEAERERHRDEARAIAVTAERDEAMRTMEAGARRQTLDNHQ